MVSSTDPAAQAWQEYQRALGALYATGATTAPAERGGASLSPDWEARSADLLGHSSRLRETLQQSLVPNELPQRELAGLKLLACAAYDLSVAGDLLTRTSGASGSGTERAARGRLVGAFALNDILGAPLANGVVGLIRPERAAISNDPLASRAQLEKRVSSFLQDIPLSSAKLSVSTLLGLLATDLAPDQLLGSAAVQELVQRMPPGVPAALGSGAGFVVESVSKMFAAMNGEQQKALAEQAAEWARDLRANSNVAARFLSNIYETKRIGAESLGLIGRSASNATAEQFNTAAQGIETLGATFEKTKSTLEWVIRVSGLVKVALLAAPVWGPLAASSIYLALLGYTVCSGGDYVDWYRLDIPWLARVRGLRTCVRDALAAPA